MYIVKRGKKDRDKVNEREKGGQKKYERER